LVTLIARCLGKFPTDRPSAAMLARELAAFADEAGVPALEKLPPPTQSADITKAWPRKRHTRAGTRVAATV
jgi:hypothetical protein